MDKLQERAESFRKLLDNEYIIKLGRKNQITELTINFERSDFFHLIGLHKLKDVINGKLRTDKIFTNCLKGNISYKMIEKSEFFCSLGNRFEYFNQLEKMLDSNEIIFKCNTNSMKKYSRIIADYELKSMHENLTFYLFIEKRAYSHNQYCKSFIHDNVVDYTYGQTKMTLLYKEKLNKRTGDSIIQYNRL